MSAGADTECQLCRPMEICARLFSVINQDVLMPTYCSTYIDMMVKPGEQSTEVCVNYLSDHLEGPRPSEACTNAPVTEQCTQEEA